MDDERRYEHYIPWVTDAERERQKGVPAVFFKIQRGGLILSGEVMRRLMKENLRMIREQNR
jgi:hypothetical protein